MSINRYTLVALAFAATSLAGCSGPATPTSASLVDRIAGSWALVAQQPAGEAESAPPAGSTFGFQLADGRASVIADCNRCGGAAAVGDNSPRTAGPRLGWYQPRRGTRPTY